MPVAYHSEHLADRGVWTLVASPILEVNRRDLVVMCCEVPHGVMIGCHEMADVEIGCNRASIALGDGPVKVLGAGELVGVDR